MEPQIPNPNFSRNPSSREVGPSLPAPDTYGSFPEVSPQQSPEIERSHETKEVSNSPKQPQPSVTNLAVPTIPVDTTISGQTQQSSQAAPQVAADDDVMEKEWVSKAKKVIAETKGNPYLQEREVSKLQADYIQKRYGKQVKIPEDV